MKRLHLHMNVPELAPSIRFYETLFGAPPTVVKDDYAKWMLDDPRVNFAISARAGSEGPREPGFNHVGVQVDTPAELAELATRLKAAGNQTFDQEATTCCYARSDKSWVNGPAGERWETFYTFGDATTYGEDPAAQAGEPNTAQPASCCGAAAPAPAPAASCC